MRLHVHGGLVDAYLRCIPPSSSTFTPQQHPLPHPDSTSLRTSGQPSDTRHEPACRRISAVRHFPNITCKTSITEDDRQIYIIWAAAPAAIERGGRRIDRKSTRLNSSHVAISYAV